MKNAFFADEVKIAVIGGGTGSFTLLSALKLHTEALAALVNMADDGGSTGQLRDEFGALPPGDIRQCLVALSNSPEMRDLFNYRFDKGTMQGHAFGNLFLTALENMSGDFARGIEIASEVLNITGVVEPVTLTNTTLVHELPDGSQERGEFQIAHTVFTEKQPKMLLDPTPEVSRAALKAIERADIVVIAPGNLYGSLAPALLVPGIGEALENTSALCVYVSNLVTKPGQTDSFTVRDFADEIERFAGRNFLDAVFYNTKEPTDDLLERYAADGELPVKNSESDDTNLHYDLVGAPLLSDSITFKRSKADPIAARRTLIRHDGNAVADAILKYYDVVRAQR